jgi:hypothetical protein
MQSNIGTVQLAGTTYRDLESLLMHIATHHPKLHPILKQLCGALFYSGFEISLLDDSIETAMATVMLQGGTTPYEESLRRMDSENHNHIGAVFLAGLETLWAKEDLELQKNNAKIVNIRVSRLAAVCLQLGPARTSA